MMRQFPSTMSFALGLYGLLFLTSTANATPYSDAVLADSPVGYWRFEDGSVANTATALNSGTTGATINGTYTGNSVVQEANPVGGLGNLGNALLLPGNSDGFVQVPDDTSIDFTTAISMEGWFRTTNTGYRRLLEKQVGGQGYILFLHANGNIQFQFSGGSDGDLITSAGTYANDAWYHVVATWSVADSNTMRIYINGSQVASGAAGTGGNAPIDLNAGVLNLGADNETNENWAGRLDEVAVYGTALSAARVLAHYNAAFEEDVIVPEPSAFILAALGLTGLGLLAWRRKK